MTSLTKDAIKKSFMKLLNEKPLNKITVKDIVEDCGINRNSFYYHFDDIPSMLEEILNEQSDMLVQDSESGSIYDHILKAIDFALSNKKAMLHLFNSSNSDFFYRYLNRVAHRAITDYIEKFGTNYSISENDKKVIIMYYKSLLIGFVIDWVSADMRYDLTTNVKRICELFEGSTETAFKRSNSDN